MECAPPPVEHILVKSIMLVLTVVSGCWLSLDMEDPCSVSRADTDLHLQEAPYDVFRVDEALSQEELTTVLRATSMWTATNAYPLLPYSCVIMESTEISSPQITKPQVKIKAAKVGSAGNGQKKVRKQRAATAADNS